MSNVASHSLSDSPWLWAALFTGVGLAALLATGGKFSKRQAGIENRYKARAAVAEGLEVETHGTGTKRTTGAPQYSTPNKLEIPLWPLQLTLVGMLGYSLYRLSRDWRELTNAQDQQ